MTATPTTRERREATGPLADRPHFAGFETLRAVAATMVLLHHASALAAEADGGLRTGRIATFASVADGGVAVFFVMSGFLLWRPMAKACLDGASVGSPAAFWWRRVLRIVPAYWLALTVLWVVGAVGLPHGWWRYYLFLQIYSADTVMHGIFVAWSLCTEMAFYLLLPLLGSVAARVTRPAGDRARVAILLGGCGLLWVGGFLARMAVDSNDEIRGLAFAWLPQNLDLFAGGMALASVSAMAATDQSLRARVDSLAQPAWAWWIAAAGLFSWYALRVGPTTFDVGYTGWYWHQRQIVLGAMTVLLLIPVVFGDQERGWLRRLWTLRPIMWVGTVSYGLYLWHLDLMELLIERDVAGFADLVARGVRSDPATLVLTAVGMAVGLGVAAISWYGLERPLGRFRSLVPRRVGPSSR